MVQGKRVLGFGVALPGEIGYATVFVSPVGVPVSRLSVRGVSAGERYGPEDHLHPALEFGQPLLKTELLDETGQDLQEVLDRALDLLLR